MFRLSSDPIGKKTTQSPAEIAQMLVSLPRRAAFIRSGEDVVTIFTEDTPEPVPASVFKQRVDHIVERTHKRYCNPKSEVEQEIMQRLKGMREPEPIAVVPEPKLQTPEPPAKREAEQPPPEQIPSTSRDKLNMLYAQLRAKEIDPDTTILAALGEHYVLAIKQWMRLIGWGSYPRATQYFKELKENDWIFRKDREGRGGKLVEGDWFFLLTKGANELVRRKQPALLFRLEPNEADKASGDTLFHTSLVNEILIHLRLLERQHPDIVRIERIDHERSMRRTYLPALGGDTKLYPDGFLRLLVPTRNGLKRQYLFLELQHTTQKDKHNWQTKLQKYLDLFDRPDDLEKFFHTRAPQVLVLTMADEYVAYHKQWTEEVLAERGNRGKAYGNRFLIGAYDTGIADNTLPPGQFFCTPRFYTPFHDAPYAVFDSESI